MDNLGEEMIAAVLKGPRDIDIEHLEIPKVSVDEVLIRVRACGICGSDIASYIRGKSNGRPPPVVLGHEFSGEIVDAGSLALDSGLRLGDRIVGEPFQPCKICSSCRKGWPNLCEHPIEFGGMKNGALAEYCRMNFHYVHRLPDSLSFEEGAFVEPFACALCALERVNAGPKDNVAVIGPGPIGLMMIQYLKASGLNVILIGTRDYRLEAGKKLGADHVINSKETESKYHASDIVEKINELTNGEKMNSVIVATGNVEANQLALRLGGRRSRTVFFGGGGYSPTDWVKLYLWENTLVEKEIHFSWLSSYAFSKSIKIIKEGVIDVKPLITHVYPLKDIIKAMEIAHKRLENVLKVIIKP